MCSLVLVTREGAITTATLNRPEIRNALNVGLLEELLAALTTAEQDATQRIFALRATGPAFCAGLDLTEAQGKVADVSANRVRDVLHRLGATRLVTIAVVHGAAVAGGAGLAAACDFVIASPNASFGFPEVHRGLVPALVMIFLRRQLRERDARELLLLGQPVDACRAREIGLVNRVASDVTALETELRAMGEAILRGGPGAVIETKKLLAELWPAALAEDFNRAHARHISARNSAEANEGIAAFQQKRMPAWPAK
jgi:enoyl-CoA hydratase/carnithine racemase